ncbi:MAG: hypothetical protein QMD65_03530 [Patescibacteria group bacterium]|nr:hypothetical protein [Patescibacteria group bacterium]
MRKNLRNATRIILFIAIPLIGLSCKNDAVVDNNNLLPEIKITSAASGWIKGEAKNIDVGRIRVVLWAKTDQWYVQPWIDKPYTNISLNGSWENYTHSWKRIVALLVDETYIPGATRMYHPSADAGVVAWDEYPNKKPDRVINFSGFNWKVKDADFAGPGPNYFSDSASNVWVDNEGLHLKINYRDGHWYCAEVFAERSLGYGTYTVQLGSRVDSLDYRAVAASFIYETDIREIDIEWSRVLAYPDNMQYVVQPWYNPGNLIRFKMPAVKYSTHQFIWLKDSVVFKSWRGLEIYPLYQDSLIQTWIYRGYNIPPPGDERMRFNLWLETTPPLSGKGDEFIIKSFSFKP